MKQLFQENRNTFIILLVLLFILIFAVYFFLYRPLAAELQQAENQEQSLNNEIITLKERVDTISLEDENSNINIERIRLEPQIPRSPELDDFLLTLNEIELLSSSRINEMSFDYHGNLPARDILIEEEEVEEDPEAGVETEEVILGIEDPKEQEPAFELEEMPSGLEPIIVTLDIQSPNYEQFQMFLKEIERQERLMVVRSLHFDKPAESELVFVEESDETITATIVVMTFYYKG